MGDHVGIPVAELFNGCFFFRFVCILGRIEGGEAKHFIVYFFGLAGLALPNCAKCEMGRKIIDNHSLTLPSEQTSSLLVEVFPSPPHFYVARIGEVTNAMTTYPKFLRTFSST